MNERTYTFDVDKSEWGEGPWVGEPDKVVWVDNATGLDCLILRNRMGSLCGYVGVPEGHPWHGKDMGDVESVDVHGGITFTGGCEPDATEDMDAICHTVSDGRPDNVWWLGFDTGHGFDVSPAMDAGMRKYFDMERPPFGTYKDINYVKNEVIDLANQAAIRT